MIFFLSFYEKQDQKREKFNSKKRDEQYGK